MPDYRKKPVVISAWQMTNNDLWESDGGEWPVWLQDAVDAGTVYLNAGGTYIKTLEGDHRVSLNDYIIQGVKGELYPCKPDIFEATYDPA